MVKHDVKLVLIVAADNHRDIGIVTEGDIVQLHALNL